MNTEVLPEILLRYRSIERREDGREVYTLVRSIVPSVEAVTAEIMDKTVELMNHYPALMARDCFHAAHCLVRELGSICSYDTDFDYIAGIDRIQPGPVGDT